MTKHGTQNGHAEWHLEPKTMEVVVTPAFENACLTRQDLVRMLKELEGEFSDVSPDLIEVKTRLKESVGGRWLS